MNDKVKYPEITVELSGNDGNAFMVLGAVGHAMKRAGVPSEEIAAFRKEATAGDYEHLLATCLEWVNVE